MLVESKMYPSKFSVGRIRRGIAEVVLRKNRQEVERELEDGGIETLYEYEEVKTEIVNRPNLEEFVEGNFEALFDKGLKEENAPEKPSLEEQINILEDELLRLQGVRE